MARRAAAFLLLLALFSTGIARAAERVELLDEDGDGRKETKIFYENNVKARVEVDKNGDGKPDEVVWFKNGRRSRAEIDSDFDGAVDKWNYYDEKGELLRAARDTNHDGKPDNFELLLKGRNLVLRERDANHDGKIDRRELTAWDGDRRISVFSNGRMRSMPNPGYATLWREQDKNFDGKVDAYYKKGDKSGEAAKAHIGQPIQTEPTVEIPEAYAPPKPHADEGSSVEARVKALNERYGLTK